MLADLKARLRRTRQFVPGWLEACNDYFFNEIDRFCDDEPELDRMAGFYARNYRAARAGVKPHPAIFAVMAAERGQYPC